MSKSDFNKLLREAVQTDELVRELEAKRKLTAKAFMREAFDIANTDDKKLDTLEAALHKPQFEASRGFHRMACKFIREPLCSSFPREVRRITWLGRSEEATAELATINSNLLELFALAVRTVVQKHPDAFGDIEDMTTHQKALTEAKQKRAELFNEIEARYTPADLQIGDVDGAGRANISFAVSGGEVPLGPHAGERLINWLRAHSEAMKSL